MATATNSTSAGPLERAFAKIFRAYASKGPGFGRQQGGRVYQSVALATTDLQSADEVTILTFPDGARLQNLWVSLTDVDTHATPTYVFDIIAEDSAGTEVVLINDSTIGQAGGYDQLDANLLPTVLDVGGSILKLKGVTSAATAATGTLKVWADITFNYVSAY